MTASIETLAAKGKSNEARIAALVAAVATLQAEVNSNSSAISTLQSNLSGASWSFLRNARQGSHTTGYSSGDSLAVLGSNFEGLLSALRGANIVA